MNYFWFYTAREDVQSNREVHISILCNSYLRMIWIGPNRVTIRINFQVVEVIRTFVCVSKAYDPQKFSFILLSLMETGPISLWPSAKKLIILRTVDIS
jgi:hypothetical protein